jgi:hypothetical protein
MMSCLLSSFHCANQLCKNIIENPSSVGQKYCDVCKRVRAVEQRAYHRYLCRMMEASL